MPAAAADAVPVIRTQGLSKVYSAGTEAEVEALRGVDLTIDRGEFVAIMGPSGSGKSTLMNLIGCLDTPSAGKYFCDGVDVASLDDGQRAKWDSARDAQLNAKRVTVYKLVDGKPQLAMARLGASDGSATEISGLYIAEGDVIIAGERSATESK